MELQEVALTLNKLTRVHVSKRECDADEVYIKVYTDGLCHQILPRGGGAIKLRTNDIDYVDMAIDVAYIHVVRIEVMKQGTDGDSDALLATLYIHRDEPLVGMKQARYATDR